MEEPWLRGTHGELGAVLRQVVHSLEMAAEDGERWCCALSDAEIDMRPYGMASVGFHLRHVVGSLDRLLTYAEGRALDEGQRAALAAESVGSESSAEVLAEFREGLRAAEARVRRFSATEFETWRGVGRSKLSSTVGGLLVHCAEHTQRHIGQAVTTAKIVMAMRAGS